MDRELGRNPELCRGTAYVTLLQAYQASGDLGAQKEGVFGPAAQRYICANGGQSARMTFNYGAADFLFDRQHNRTVLVWGVSRTVASHARDKAYHASHSTAGPDLDEGHAWSQA